MMRVAQLPNIPCGTENHRGMGVEYVCLDALCQENSRAVCCLYCCQEFHQEHIQQVTAIKLLLAQLPFRPQGQGFDLLNALLTGISSCASFAQLQTNLAELLAYRSNPNRFEDLVDEEARALHKKAQEYYQRAQKQQAQQQLARKSSQLAKPAITPVLTFKEGSNYTLNSPFSVTLAHEELTTVFALPALSKFHHSIDITLKVDRLTPSWLAIGLSFGQNKYEEGSSKHILAISNGWLANKGVLARSKLRFGAGDSVRVRWDKEKSLVQWECGRQRLAVGVQGRWSQEVLLCVCLFYAGDSVRVLA